MAEEIGIPATAAKDNSTGGSSPRFWPDVSTEAGALLAIRRAFWAALFVTATTTLYSVLGAVGVGFARKLGMDVWGLVDAVLFASIAVGIHRRSQLAAWSGLLLYIAERMYMWNRTGVKGPVVVMTAIFVLAFIGGVRGTTAVQQRVSAEEEASRTDQMGSVAN